MATKKSKAVKNDLSLIYLITGGDATEQNFNEKRPQILTLVKIAVETRISLIQIREKNLSAGNVFNLAREAVEIARNSAAKILVNDRADIALAAKAGGVHLTANSLSAEIIRRNFPKDFIIGVSAHTIEKAEQAKREGANFATFSPIFASPTKGEPKGLDALREACERLKPFPIIALGGIDETNYESVLENGASGFAAIRFLNNIENLSGKFLAKPQRTRKENK
ncbi:MAG: thiamine phosphate synthase [Pyrinomonadaceae bacterium]